jgi:DNA modification methylase
VLRGLPSDCVDMVCTSPPYDGLRNYKGFSFNFEDTARELFRVVKDGGVVVWVVNDATVNGSETGTSFRQALLFNEVGFNIHDTMIWEKTNPLPIRANRYNGCFEYMFVFSKGKPRVFNPLTVACKGAGTIRTRRNSQYERLEHTASRPDRPTAVTCNTKPRNNVWRYPIGQTRGLAHPAIFPLELAKDHISTWTNPGDLVLDCCAGAGTSLLAAKLLNRNYLGIEIASDYVAIANARLGAN